MYLRGLGQPDPDWLEDQWDTAREWCAGVGPGHPFAAICAELGLPINPEGPSQDPPPDPSDEFPDPEVPPWEPAQGSMASWLPYVAAGAAALLLMRRR